MAVYLDRPPRSVFLVAWGRAPDAWWGCIQFQQTIATPDGPAQLDAAAMGAGRVVEPSRLVRASGAAAIDLSHDRRGWPAPQAGRPGTPAPGRAGPCPAAGWRRTSDRTCLAPPPQPLTRIAEPGRLAAEPTSPSGWLTSSRGCCPQDYS